MTEEDLCLTSAILKQSEITKWNLNDDLGPCLTKVMPVYYYRQLAPILAGKADTVFGSRFCGGDAHRVFYYWHSVGNNFLTMFSNMATNLNLADIEICYKAFRREVIQKIQIKENRFGFEPEISAKFSKAKVRIYEVEISYTERTYAEGKIGWRDCFHALWCIWMYNFGSNQPTGLKHWSCRLNPPPLCAIVFWPLSLRPQLLQNRHRS